MLQERMIQAQLLARQSGTMLRASYAEKKAVKNKGRIDLLTEYDLQSEHVLVDGIRQAFPHDAIVSEESHPGHASGDFWLIDPIDGTTNFAHGLPDFNICMAYVRDGSLVLGLIYNPVRDEMYSAILGEGAFLNGARLRVSSETSLERSLLAAGYPYDLSHTPYDVFGMWQRVFYRSRGIRHFGCASLNPAYVAAGRIEAYWESAFRPWDLAGGMLLVREAGGTVTRLDGGDDPLAEPCTMLATNGHLHTRLLELLNEQPGHPGGG